MDGVKSPKNYNKKLIKRDKRGYPWECGVCSKIYNPCINFNLVSIAFEEIWILAHSSQPAYIWKLWVKKGKTVQNQWIQWDKGTGREFFEMILFGLFIEWKSIFALNFVKISPR